GIGTAPAATNGFVERAWFAFDSNTATLVPGDNSVIFQVTNGGTAANPTGLRVDDINVRAAPIDSLPIPGLFNTGVDDSGGSADSHYEAIVVPAGSAEPTIAIPSPPSPPWIQRTSTSQWIGPNDPGGNGPEGEYQYQLTFDMTGLDPASAVISGLWSVDNSTTEILLNGQPTGITQDGSFINLSYFELSAANGHTFLPGENTLVFPVVNAPASNNPIGLRVEGLLGYAQPVPEPGALAMIVGMLVGMLRLRRTR
ncbi:MAG: hypothetical protein KDA60_22270, partial [Planctomycetales bacterium]|nr:hypothetical protein [Planctomycetales bacterium]